MITRLRTRPGIWLFGYNGIVAVSRVVLALVFMFMILLWVTFLVPEYILTFYLSFKRMTIFSSQKNQKCCQVFKLCLDSCIRYVMFDKITYFEAALSSFVKSCCGFGKNKRVHVNFKHCTFFK